MNTSKRLRKYLVIGIILLFISIAIAPTINYTTVKAVADNDTIEVTTEACGIKGFGNTTVKITRQQYQNLEQYLVGFRARLNKTTTREEAVPIFNEAVVELNKYGLLPNGMSVEKAQKLVTGQYQNSNENIYVNKLHLISSLILNDDNDFCLLVGRTDNTIFCGPLVRFYNEIYYRVFNALLTTGDWLYRHNIISLTILIDILFALWINIIGVGEIFLDLYSYLFSLINPLPFSDIIYLGYWDEIGYGGGPAEGWIYTNGLNGVKEWNNSFWGDLPIAPYEDIASSAAPGITGFTGIRILLDRPIFLTKGDIFYMGTALRIKISPYS
jgi:hypothetical protein